MPGIGLYPIRPVRQPALGWVRHGRAPRHSAGAARLPAANDASSTPGGASGGCACRGTQRADLSATGSR